MRKGNELVDLSQGERPKSARRWPLQLEWYKAEAAVQRRTDFRALA
ncbi:hypothetical protein [Bacillus sp. P14.5]|nr:hypothetical protein [Bacillus sp. P14.5]